MFRIVARERDTELTLGFRGENEAREVSFDNIVARWSTILGDGVPELLVQPPESNSFYPALLSVAGTAVRWVVRNSDTKLAGFGTAQLNYLIGNRIAKSIVWTTEIMESLSGTEEPVPGPEQPWVDEVLGARSDAIEAANRAEAASDHPPVIQDGTWFVWSKELGGYQDTALPAQGPQGDLGPKGDPGNLLYGVFHVDPATGILSMYADKAYNGPKFAINKNGHMEVLVSG